MMKSVWQRIICGVSLLSVFFSCENKSYTIQTTVRHVDSLSQIVLLEDSLVQPIVYSGIAGLETQPVPMAKEMFISAILPAILITKFSLRQEQQKILELMEKENWTSQDSAQVQSLEQQYQATDLDNLILRLETVPNCIALAQAAVESGWGQSRFFLEGNNVFGIWSNNANDARMATDGTRNNQAVYVRAYPTLEESVRHYFATLARSYAYRSLRQTMKETNNPFELLPHLRFYSERREAYVQQLRTVIESNELTKYDHFQIAPQYIVAQ